MKPGAAWRELGLTPDSEAGAVRQAYANRLRAIDPDADPAAFARLRAARDAALGDIRRRAASLASATDDPFAEAETTADPVAPWPHAAPVVDMPVPPGHVQSRGDPPAEPARPAARAAAGPADAPLVVPVALFGPPVLSAPGKGDVLADRGRGAALQQVLTKAPAIEPFDAADEASAIDHLRALLRIASAQPIEQSRAVEDWIADQLTQCWPRSAPLLAPAAEAFGWSSERGKIGERPALAFLNARLAGLRFVDAVERAGLVRV